MHKKPMQVVNLCSCREREGDSLFLILVKMFFFCLFIQMHEEYKCLPLCARYHEFVPVKGPQPDAPHRSEGGGGRVRQLSSQTRNICLICVTCFLLIWEVCWRRSVTYIYGFFPVWLLDSFFQTFAELSFQTCVLLVSSIVSSGTADKCKWIKQCSQWKNGNGDK